MMAHEEEDGLLSWNCLEVPDPIHDVYLDMLFAYKIGFYSILVCVD